jgi:hypothetical protein
VGVVVTDEDVPVVVDEELVGCVGVELLEVLDELVVDGEVAVFAAVVAVLSPVLLADVDNFSCSDATNTPKSSKKLLKSLMLLPLYVGYLLLILPLVVMYSKNYLTIRLL